jgi:CPA1 family monovalent cation:H+ antiporter
MVASAVGIVVKWVRLPYSIGLVIVGLAIGTCHLLPEIAVTPELILLVFLPALLFEASWNINLTELKRNAQPISVLSSLGVIISTFICAFTMSSVCKMTFIEGLLFGSLISATDPISVLSLFRRLGLDRRLSLIFQGESLFNDGTSVVLFQLILVMALTKTFPPVYMTLLQFFMNILGGVIIGLATGFGSSRLIRFFDDRLLEITLTTVVAYGSFLIAEQLNVSSVLAVLTAGIVIGNYGSRTSMSATSRIAVNAFWEYAAFLVNSLVFLLIGMQIHLESLIRYSSVIGVGIVAILIARIVVIFGLTPFISTKTLPIPASWQTLLTWGALRGSISMAMALSLPFSFPGREQMIVLTFGIVLFTLLVPGLTIEPLAKLLKLSMLNKRLGSYQSLQGQLVAENQALQSLVNLFSKGLISKKVFDQLEAEIRIHQDSFIKSIDDLHLTNNALESLQLSRARRQLLEARKDAIIQLARTESMDRDVVEQLLFEIDGQLEQLTTAEEEIAQAI